MGSSADEGVPSVIALERRLLQPSVRASPTALDALLDPGFREVDASRRVWTRDRIMRALTSDPGTAMPVHDEDMDGRHLADDLILLTYLSYSSGRRARHSSLWGFDAIAGWRLLHHQGTLVEQARLRLGPAAGVDDQGYAVVLHPDTRVPELRDPQGSNLPDHGLITGVHQPPRRSGPVGGAWG